MNKALAILATGAVLFSAASCMKDEVSKKVTGNITEEYLDGSNYFAWPADASISLFPGTVDNVKYDISSGAGKRSATFKTDTKKAAGQPIDATVALYPYNSSASVSMADGLVRVSTNLPATQTFPQAGKYGTGACPLVAITGTDSETLPFFAPVGGVSFKLTGEAVITKVELTANGGETLNGDITFTTDGEVVRDVQLSGGSSKLTLDCGEGIQLTQVAKDFVFFVPFGTYEQGFTATVTSSTGDLNVLSIPNIKTVHQARILNISRNQFAIYEDLNADSPETANCYMVKKVGGYYFNATVKGNGKGGIHPTFKDQDPNLSPAGAKLVWESTTGLVTGVTLAEGKIYFACSGKNGNAVVAATNETGEVIWSWHIWSTGGPVDVPLGDDGYWILMDRNLGATEPMDPGLYYQWGRKDPFAGDFEGKDSFDSGNGEGKYHPVHGGSANLDQCTIEYSIAHPEAYIANCGRNNDWLLETPQRYLWGLNWEVDQNPAYQPFKTIYDPCPAGYEVTTPSAYAYGLEIGGVNNGTHIVIFNGAITVPAGGFIYNGGWGWYGKGSWTGLWSCSTSWGNTDNAFRLEGTSDPRSNYDRACGHPVRCMRIQNK